MRKLRKNTKHGFTLTEMLLVVAILLILASVLAIGAGSYISKSRTVSNKVDQKVTSMQTSNAAKVTKLSGYGF